MTLKASVSGLTPTIVVTHTEVGPIPSQALTDVFNAAASEFIMPFLNDLGQRGYPIPMIPYVRLINPRLLLESHALCVVTDLQYTH